MFSQVYQDFPPYFSPTVSGTVTEFSEAIAEVEKTAKLDPNDPANQFSLGSALAAIGNMLNVRDDCGPLDRNYYQALGMARQELGEMNEALAAFESGLALEPNDKGALVGAFRAASAPGDAKKRREYSKRLRHIGMDDSTISLLSK